MRSRWRSSQIARRGWWARLCCDMEKKQIRRGSSSGEKPRIVKRLLVLVAGTVVVIFAGTAVLHRIEPSTTGLWIVWSLLWSSVAGVLLRWWQPSSLSRVDGVPSEEAVARYHSEPGVLYRTRPSGKSRTLPTRCFRRPYRDNALRPAHTSQSSGKCEPRVGHHSANNRYPIGGTAPELLSLRGDRRVYDAVS